MEWNYVAKPQINNIARKITIGYGQYSHGHAVTIVYTRALLFL